MIRVTTSRVLSDAAIARHAAGGSQRAFAAIFDRYHQDLFRYCAALLGNAEDAHDAVQNTMLKVLRALPGEQRELKLKPWLYRIAHNEAIDMIRARKSTEPIEVESLVALSSPAEEAEARERLRQLASDIAELPASQRGALVMREMGGLSYEQISEALQTSQAVARQTIYEARLSLRQIDEGREMPCEEVMRAISDDDGRVLRRRDIGAHLRHCESCREFRSGISDRRREFASFAPLPAAAAAGMLQGLLGGAAGGSGVAGSAAGVAAGKALVGSAAIKSAAAVCVVSALGIVAADNSGVIDVGLDARRDRPGATETRAAPPAGTPAAAAARLGANGRAARGERSRSVRRSVGKATISGRPASRQTGVAQGPPAHRAAEGPAESNGRHLGQAKHSDRGKGLGTAGHPAKGKKTPAGSPPGQLENPGHAKHAAAKDDAKKGATRATPPHKPHPSKPGQSRAPATTEAKAGAKATAPPPESGSPATDDPGHGKPEGKVPPIE